MTTKKPRITPDLRLKFAILEKGLTQRRVGLDTRIGETRMSELVGGRGMPPTARERQALAKYLERAIEDLFVIDLEAGPDRKPVPRRRRSTPASDEAIA